MKKILTITSSILPVVAVVFIISQVLFTNELAGITKELHALDATIATLTNENTTLERQVASESSTLAISTKAKEGGFIEAKKIMTLSDKDFQVALQIPR